MIRIEIRNPSVALASEPRNLGAAVRIIMAGGGGLDDAAARRAAGVSAFVWKSHGPAILSLVAELEQRGEADA